MQNYVGKAFNYRKLTEASNQWVSNAINWKSDYQMYTLPLMRIIPQRSGRCVSQHSQSTWLSLYVRYGLDFEATHYLPDPAMPWAFPLWNYLYHHIGQSFWPYSSWCLILSSSLCRRYCLRLAVVLVPFFAWVVRNGSFISLLLVNECLFSCPLIFCINFFHGYFLLPLPCVIKFLISFHHMITWPLPSAMSPAILRIYPFHLEVFPHCHLK